MINGWPGVPDYFGPYMEFFDAAGADYQLPPLFIGSVCDIETKVGLKNRPPGPAGTGDWNPRKRGTRYLDEARYKVIPRKPGIDDDLVMPADGLGWGRGLMQLDYHYQKDMVENHDWRDPLTNIYLGSSILSQGAAAFGSDWFLVAAAYNCGVSAVRTALARAATDGLNDADRRRLVDSYTAAPLHNYASRVTARFQELKRALEDAAPTTT